MRVDIYIAPCGSESGLIVYACPRCGTVDSVRTDEIVTHVSDERPSTH